MISRVSVRLIIYTGEAVFIPPRSAIICNQAVGNSASRMYYTLKTPSKQGGEDAFVHHVRIVFPFRREGTCQ